MERSDDTGNHDRTDNAGIERFDAGNHRQAAARSRIDGEIDAEEVAPGHPHGVNKVVPRQETHQHRQASSTLRLFCQANGQADGKNQGHVTKDRPATFFNNMNNLSK